MSYNTRRYEDGIIQRAYECSRKQVIWNRGNRYSQGKQRRTDDFDSDRESITGIVGSFLNEMAAGILDAEEGAEEVERMFFHATAE